MDTYNSNTGNIEHNEDQKSRKKQDILDPKIVHEKYLKQIDIREKLDDLKKLVIDYSRRTKLTDEEEDTIFNTYEKISGSDEANYYLGNMYISGGNISQGAYFIKKSLSISNKFKDDFEDLLRELVLEDAKKGLKQKYDEDFFMFLAIFRDDLIGIIRKDLSDNIPEDEKFELKRFLSVLEEK